MFDDDGAVDADGLYPALAAAIDGLPTVQRGGSAVELGERLIAIVELERRLAAARLEMLDAFHEQGFASAWGCDNAGSFLRAHTRIDPRAARAQVAAAGLARRMPSLGALAACGAIGAEHLQAVASGLKDLPDDVAAEIEPTLADAAGWARPVELHRLAARAREIHRAEHAAKGEDEARQLRALTLVQTFEGLWDLKATLPAEDGAALQVLLAATSGRAGEEDARTPTQRRADGLAAIVALANRAGQAPALGGDRPRITLVVRADQAAQLPSSPLPPTGPLSPPDAGAAGMPLGPGRWATRPGLVGELTGHQLELPDAVIQRIACDADLDLLTLDGDGEVLTLGRSNRHATTAQRRALVIRDGGCVFPYCDRPPWQCQPHHLTWWSNGGLTDLPNLALLCSFHHHLVHDDGWAIQRIPPDERPFGHTGIAWQATSPDGRTLREPYPRRVG